MGENDEVFLRGKRDFRNERATTPVLDGNEGTRECKTTGVAITDAETATLVRRERGKFRSPHRSHTELAKKPPFLRVIHIEKQRTVFLIAIGKRKNRERNRWKPRMEGGSRRGENHSPETSTIRIRRESFRRTLRMVGIEGGTLPESLPRTAFEIQERRISAIAFPVIRPGFFYFPEKISERLYPGNRTGTFHLLQTLYKMGKLKDYFPDCDENPEPTLTPEEEDAMMESLLDFESLCDNPSATTEESEEMWNW